MNSQPYAFTEFITFDFAVAVASDLEDEATLIGQLWAKTLQVYISHLGVKAVWWGQRLGLQNSHQILLIIGKDLYYLE
jgi:hypothetical protein